MPGCVPEILTGYMGCVEQFVVVPVVFVFPVVLNQPSELRSFGLPENQARTDLIVDGKELEILAESAVVSLLRFFQVVEMLLQ